MTEQKYSRQANENMAKALLRSAPISSKQSIEICSFIRGKTLAKAKKILQDSSSMKKPIPFKRFNGDVGHKAGMGPGRYAVKASEHILGILESVQANAVSKGLDVNSLVIAHINAHKASRPMRGGSKRGQAAKRTHVEVMVEEVVKKEVKAKSKPAKVKTTKAVEVKKAEAKEVKTEAIKPEVTQVKAEVETKESKSEGVKND